MAAKEIDREHAHFNMSLVVEWIKFAEGKATAILTFATAILGAAITAIPTATDVCIELSAMCAPFSYGAIGITVAFLAFVLTLGISIYHSLQVVRPRLITTSKNHSWFFFQSMSLLSPDDYHTFCSVQNEDTLMHQLFDQIFNNACVARQKYAGVQTSLWWLVLSCAIGATAVTTVLILKEVIGGK